MKGNQGLEALAALCGGETKARTDDQATNTTSTQSNNSAKAAPAPAPMPTSTTIRPSASLPSPTAPLLPAPLDAMQQPPPAVGVDPSFQHWQSMAAAYGGIPNAATTAAAAAILQAAAVQTGGAPQPHPSPADPNAFGAMQQLAYYQCLHAQAAAAQAQVQAQAQAAHMLGPDGKPASVPGVPVAAPYKIDATTPATLPLPGQQMQIPSQIDPSKRMNSQQHQSPQQPPQTAHQPHPQPPLHATLQQVIPGPANGTPTAPAPIAASSSSATNSMQPPPPPSQMTTLPSALSTQGLMLSHTASAAQQPPQQLPIAPVSTPATKIMPMKMKPPQQTAIVQRPSSLENSLQGMDMDDKKQQKRAANRRSAQLSRKRKKQFIEELKEENDELRRKEQILKSIPDLIVVFDSAGRLGFVSHSVTRFLDFSPAELEGSSFWNRLCDESVRLLKAAFMDALAARKSDMDTTPLGSGVWELRLVDKDGTHKVITLNGVVHFSGEAPECVCSIRPRDEENTNKEQTQATAATPLIRPNIKPNQSVINNTGADSASVRLAKGKAPTAPTAGRKAAQISDGDSGSVVSESGSE